MHSRLEGAPRKESGALWCQVRVFWNILLGKWQTLNKEVKQSNLNATKLTLVAQQNVDRE